MDIHKDVLKFSKLSTQYRDAVADGEKQNADVAMRKIKQLISGAVNQASTGFHFNLDKKKSQFQNKGVPMIGMSIPKILNNQKKLVCFNPNAKKGIFGVNMLLDYSGSMWFRETRETINGAMRIYSQNYIALVVAGTIAKQNNEHYITITPFCRDAFVGLEIQNGNFMTADWDALIVHNEWGSGISMGKRYLPTKMSHTDRNWFQDEYVDEAIEFSIKTHSKKGKMAKFTNLLMTDGGLNRLGETEEDMIDYLTKSIAKISTFAKTNQNSWLFIKQQKLATEQMCKKFGIDYNKVNTKEELEQVFLKIVSLTTKRR